MIYMYVYVRSHSCMQSDEPKPQKPVIGVVKSFYRRCKNVVILIFRNLQSVICAMYQMVSTKLSKSVSPSIGSFFMSRDFKLRSVTVLTPSIADISL